MEIDYYYDDAVRHYTNTDLNGDGIVQKAEFVQRMMADFALDKLDEETGFYSMEYPYTEEVGKRLFDLMDVKYW